jgi:aspartate kinase
MSVVPTSLIYKRRFYLHMIVMKFGGTSVKDADAILSVLDIVEHESARNPLVVLSACAGVTDTLIRIARSAASGDDNASLTELTSLRERHLRIAQELLTGFLLTTTTTKIIHQCEELELLVRGVSILRELTPRVFDHFMSFGEGWSTLLTAHAAIERGKKAVLVDSRTILRTNDEFTRAIPDFAETAKNTHVKILPLIESGHIVITQGFIGASPGNITTTLGRGGSDYSAAIFGTVLDADEIQIWTDVDGVLTANPNLVPEARLIRELTFNEAAELAYFGAKVLHPSTILPAIKKKIPVRVLNSLKPDYIGTLITANGSVPTDGSMHAVKAIAHKEGITIIRIQSTRMLMAHGFLARVFEIFARFKKSVDVIATSEVGISLTVDDTSGIEDIVRELREIADVTIEDKKAVFSVVGENLKYSRGIAGKTFTALAEAGVNIELISHGGSEINITFVISETQVRPALRAIHREFFTNPPGQSNRKKKKNTAPIDKSR